MSLLSRFGILISIYSKLRLLFFAFIYQALQSASPREIAAAFAVRLGADIWAIALTNGVVVLLAWLLRHASRLSSKKPTNAAFLPSNLPFLLINVVDTPGRIRRPSVAYLLSAQFFQSGNSSLRAALSRLPNYPAARQDLALILQLKRRRTA